MRTGSLLGALNRLLTVVAVCGWGCVCPAAVTHTWKGGDGNWSDPAMWQASDGSVGSYPNAADAVAEFPAGLTNTVFFTEDVTVSNVLMRGASTWMTFKCAGQKYTLSVPKASNEHGIFVNGDGCSFTMDNIKISGGGGLHGSANSAYFYGPGKNGVFRLKNGALLDWVLAYFTAAGARLELEAGTTVQVGSCRMNCPRDTESTLVISNALFKFGAVTSPLGRYRVVFQGDTPRFQGQRSIGNNFLYEFELPQTEYANPPVSTFHAYGASENMPLSGCSFAVSGKSPALRENVSNTWWVVAWNSSDSSKDPQHVLGVPTNGVVWTGLRRIDTFSFGWRTTGATAQDPAVANPAYLYVTLGRKPGMAMLLR